MKTKMMAGLLILLVIIFAIAYTFIQYRGITQLQPTQPKIVAQTDQQIDLTINQEMDKTLANVNQADVEQALLS